jgi:hypothetical protein
MTKASTVLPSTEEQIPLSDSCRANTIQNYKMDPSDLPAIDE